MDQSMQLLVLILNKKESLDELFDALVQIGVKGATLVESTGMARIIGDDSHSLFGSIRMLIDPDLESNYMVFMAVNDSLVNLVRKTISETLGGLDKPDTGVLFGVPITFFDGKVPKE
jgi:nitrogen regulatory protein PII